MHEEIITMPQESEQPFQVQMAGISYCDGSYRIERRNSGIHCLEYIISGTGFVQENTASFTASQGDVYLLHRGQNHLYYSDANTPWVKIWMNVYGPLSDQLMTLYGLNHICHIPAVPEMETPFRTFVENARLLTQRRPNSTPAALLFHSILIGLSSLLHKSNHITLASQVKQAIDNAPNYVITLDEITHQLFCSKSHAIKVFREAYGITPHEYILQQKIQLAMLLLQNSSLPIGHIADMLGFCDSHYFSGFFRSRAGMPPKQYRRQGNHTAQS